jgi:heme-degrading monooxygenase HmoA
MAESKNPNRVVSFFRYRMNKLNDAQRAEYDSAAARLYQIVSAMPGFISYREYEGHNGELLGVTEWASAEALAAWRDHPEHRTAQELGRKLFYSEYVITICTVHHEYGFKDGQQAAR